MTRVPLFTPRSFNPQLCYSHGIVYVKWKQEKFAEIFFWGICHSYTRVNYLIMMYIQSKSELTFIVLQSNNFITLKFLLLAHAKAHIAHQYTGECSCWSSREKNQSKKQEIWDRFVCYVTKGKKPSMLWKNPSLSQNFP